MSVKEGPIESVWITGSKNASRRGLFGGTGALIVLAFLLLPSVAVGVQPQNVHRAPYSGSTSAPSKYLATGGCGKAFGAPLKWNPIYGVVKGKNHASASFCGGSPNGPPTYSDAFALDSTTVVIPFRVPHAGNNTIKETWTLKLNASQSITGSGCPNMTVNYHPAFNTSSEAYCESYSALSFTMLEWLVDLNNGSFTTFNYASFANDTSLLYENDTTCSHYKKAVSCLNTTGWSNSTFQYGQNEWDTGFTFAGKTVLHLWTNGTGMLAAHSYGLVVTIQLGSSVQLSGYRLVSPWVATGFASINMGVPGYGARLDSITVT